MANREWINKQQSISGIEVRVWGRQGVDARMDIERKLSVTLNIEIASFVETVGNASIGPFMSVIAGSGDGVMSAITETESCRKIANAMPMHFVKVMDDQAGGSYFYNATTGEVEVFESVPLNTDPNSRMRVFPGFDKFLEWIFEEAKLQLKDNEFTF